MGEDERRGFFKELTTGMVFNPSSMVPAIFTTLVEQFALVSKPGKSASRLLEDILIKDWL